MTALVLSLGQQCQQSVLHAILTFDMRVVTMRPRASAAEKRDEML